MLVSVADHLLDLWTAELEDFVDVPVERPRMVQAEHFLVEAAAGPVVAVFVVALAN